jgi:acetylornithine deacetylase/succinyl-diaminopimelate desuccinylase-like protein
MRVAALVLQAALALSATPPPEPTRYEDLAVDLLRRYLAIDTKNPPGQELRAARFFKERFEREGIPVELDEFAPGRANLLAVLPGSGARRALILSNHMDVVPADASRWSVPPFSGRAEGGFVYGRGAEDMKTEAILHLLALVRAKREGLALDRDLVFLATADEEVGFGGALRALSPEGWRDRLKGAEYLITEGGENLLVDGQATHFGVDTGEKGAFWLTLRTTGSPGHGSQPIADSAPNRLVRALERIRLHRTELKVLPTVEASFRAQAARLTPPQSEWYRDLRKALKDPVAVKALSEDRAASAQLRNTISITVVRVGYKTNVIPGTAEAELDVRLLPGEDPEAFLSELRRAIADPTVDIRHDRDFRPPNQSPIDTELFAAIREVLGRHYPGVPVVPRLLTGATESVLFRPLGIHCYGFTPLLTSAAELDSGHGDDERINEATVRASTGIFYEVVRRIAGRR